MRLAAVALSLAGLAGLSGCGTGSKPLPVYGTVPAFTLTAQTGREFHSASLEGKIWVADFIFTHCMGPCPRMTSQMHFLEKQARDLPGVRFVSFTVDPARDTPQALASYAEKFRADTSRWYFLTGARETLHELDRNAFKLGSVDGSLTHSTRFVLVDGQARIRGYYETSDPDWVKPLLGDIRRLAKEAS